jgi:hypothetical protein
MNTTTDLIQILTAKKIGQSTNQELAGTLIKIYILIGLRKQNYPSEIENKMIVSYLLTHYAQKSLDELYLAFDLAVQDKLDYELKVYDAFTIPMIVGVMNGYKKWAFNEVKKIHKPIALPPILKVTHEEKIKECDEWEEKKDIRLQFIPTYLYDWMVLIGRINLTQEQKDEVMNKAANYRLSQLQNESEQDRSNRHEYKRFADILVDGIKNIEGIEKDRLKNLAKKIAVFEYLKSKK